MDEPRSSRNHGLIGQAEALLELGRPHEALQLAGMAAFGQPSDATVHCVMATGHLATGETGEAGPHIARALELEPSWEWAHRLQAMLLLRQAEDAGRRRARRLRKRAVAAARNAVHLGPVIHDAHCILAFAELTLGHVPQARAASRQAVELAPDEAAGWVVVALVELTDEQWAAAAYAAGRALHLDPSDEAAATVLSSARQKLGGTALPGTEPDLRRAS